VAPREDAVVVEGGTDRPPLDEQIARHVLEVPERHSPPTPHCDYCWEEWPCTVELMRHEAERLRRVEAAAREAEAAFLARPDTDERDHPEGLTSEQVNVAFERWDLRQQLALAALR
jgi:hypothetical protein